MKKRLKYGLCTAAFISAAFFGDAIDINDKLYYPIRYRNTPISETNYQDPFSIRKRYVVNNGLLEVQIGDENNNQYYPVTGGLRVNERKIPEQLMDSAESIFDSLSRRANNLTGRLKKAYEGLRR